MTKETKNKCCELCIDEDEIHDSICVNSGCPCHAQTDGYNPKEVASESQKLIKKYSKTFTDLAKYDKGDRIMKTCTSIDCPERTGGKCTAGEQVCNKCVHGGKLTECNRTYCDGVPFTHNQHCVECGMAVTPPKCLEKADMLHKAAQGANQDQKDTYEKAVRAEVIKEVEERLKHIVMYHDSPNNMPCYSVRDVLDVLNKIFLEDK